MKEIKIPTDFVDNYILKADAQYAIVYLYAYRHKADGNKKSAAQIASALNIPLDVVDEAIFYWAELGHDIFSDKKLPPVTEKSRYSAKEITEFTEGDEALAILYEETEKILSKPLSSGEQQTLFWIYNDLGMSAAVIILMLNYAKSIGKPKIRYVEKIAMEWSEKGIITFADAEEYLEDLERASSYESRIKKLFGLERNLTSTEKAVIAGWCNELKPTKDNLINAYEICIERTGKFSVKYINAVLVNQREKKVKATHHVPTPKATKFNNFSQQSKIDYKKFEMDALKKRLSKSRGEKQ